jgi:hypothetical protein
MPHQCENILASIVTILKAGGTDASTRVYRGRTVPPEAAEGDVILVYEGDEESAPDDLNYRKVRTLDVAVELHKRATAADVNDPGAIETAMNDFYREAEVALEASVNLSGTCLKFEHVFTQRERNGEGDQETRCLTLGLRVHYRTVRTDPGTQA